MSSSDYDSDASHPSFPQLKQLRVEMRGNWRHDDNLLDKLFPIPADANKCCEDATRELYNKATQSKPGRWKRIPSHPRSRARLFTPLTNLLNNILECYGISRESRLFLDTHNGGSTGHFPTPIEPGIFLAGIGPEFVTTNTQLPRPNFPSAISIFEVVLDSDNLAAARDRLVVHMHRVFHNQSNRRFAFGLVITQNNFTLYMFDHSGTVSSRPCNYHRHPERFCAVISALASEGMSIGFDTSIFLKDRRPFIRTLEPDGNQPPKPTIYQFRRELFHFWGVVGRATVCCLASKDGTPFVIKDAWISPSNPPGRESEYSLVLHARSKGVRDGIVDICHFEEVRFSGGSDFDSVIHNRRAELGPADALRVERVHTRTVMTTYGRTLQQFSGRMELILAFYDAVCAHRNLYDIAGILHRDISPRNILINPNGVEGNRGILIDFDHSIRIDDTSPYSTKQRIGTRRFMSRNVLSDRGPHTYIDDLESFYFVLCWILAGYERPGVVRSPIPLELQTYDLPGASDYKDGLIAGHTYEISPWFGSALRDLTVRLTSYFERRIPYKDLPYIPLDPKQDYDEFLDHVRRSISDLEKEPPFKEGPLLEAKDDKNDKGAKGTENNTASDGGEDAPRRRPKRKPAPPIMKRPRRSTADYGRTKMV